MSPIGIIKNSKLINWWNSLSCLFFTLLGSLLPFIISILLVRLFGGPWDDWMLYFKHGEFSIYSAGLLTTSIYVLLKNENKGKFIFGLLITFLIASAVIVAAILLADLGSLNLIKMNATSTIDQPFLFVITLILFVVSVFFYGYSLLEENVLIGTNSRNELQADYEELAKKYNKEQ